MPLGHLQNRVHLTANAGVMNHHDSLGTRRDEAFKLGLIKIKRVRPDVYENGPSTAQDESVNGRYERERRDDYLVTRLEVEEQRRHLKCVRAGGRQQRSGNARLLLQQGLAPFGKESVAGEMKIIYGLLDVIKFFSNNVRLVKWNHELVRNQGYEMSPHLLARNRNSNNPQECMPR